MVATVSCIALTKLAKQSGTAIVIGVIERGGSVIISPMGKVLAGPLYNKDGLISAEIDLNDIVKARYDMDPMGHYSRPDVFKLTVNEQERPPISIIGNGNIKDILIPRYKIKN